METSQSMLTIFNSKKRRKLESSTPTSESLTIPNIEIKSELEKKEIGESYLREKLELVEKFMRSSKFEDSEEVRRSLSDCLIEGSVSLNLENSAISDENLIKSVVPFLNKNKTIKELNISINSLIGDEGVVFLAKNCSLSKLKCGSTCVDSDGIIALAKNPSIVYLDVHQSFSDNSKKRMKMFQSLASNTSIKTLIMHGGDSIPTPSIEDELIKILASNKTITKLDISFYKISDKGIKYLSKNETIKNLHINGIEKLTQKGLKSLSKNTHLKELSLADNNINDEGFGLLSSHPKLKRLNITNNNNMTDEGALLISRLKNLRNICIVSNNKITDVGIEYLSNSPHLKEIFFARPREKGKKVLIEKGIKLSSNFNGFSK